MLYATALFTSDDVLCRMASIAVIVCDIGDDPFNLVGTQRPILAYVASNPQLRAAGRDEKEALEMLRANILGHAHSSKKRKAVEMDFDDLLVEEIMEW